LIEDSTLLVESSSACAVGTKSRARNEATPQDEQWAFFIAF
jgi:hypothetical protein